MDDMRCLLCDTSHFSLLEIVEIDGVMKELFCHRQHPVEQGDRVLLCRDCQFEFHVGNQVEQ